MSSLLATCLELFGTRNLYKVLDVKKSATSDQIKKAYHKASLCVHPDRVSEEERPECTRKFQCVGGVFAALSDEAKRALYDGCYDTDDEEDRPDNGEGEGENLFGNDMEADFRENPELDRFDPTLFDEEEYETLSEGKCQAAETSIRKTPMYPDGWEDDSDNKTILSGGINMGSPTLNELYEAGLYGGSKHSDLGPSRPAYLDPEEEENFCREDRRSSRYRQAERLRTTQDLEEFVKTIPLLLAEDNETDEHREIWRLKEMRRRRVSPGKSVRKPSNVAMSGIEKESLKRTQAE